MSTPPISQLCRNCSPVLDLDFLLDHNPINNKGYRPYETSKILYRFEDTWPELPGFAASAESGCGLCKSIRDTFVSQYPSTEYKGPVTGYVSRSATSIQVEPRKVSDYSVTICEGRDLNDTLAYAQFLPCSDDDSMPFLRPPLTEVLSDQTLNFAKRSIDHCASTCHPWEPSGSTPARLLDIGEYKANGRIKLIQTEGLPRVRYAALSYCWGNADDAAYQPKTNSANLSERLDGFGIDAMSPVVRDAIITCDALEMRYLWVDALCILQGKADIADWEVESQKMNDIFRNAYVTLCPSSSNGCREGFLGQRKLHPGICNESQEYSIIPYDVKAITPSFMFTFEFTDSKWYSRAWVWQEVNFSARLVIFGPTFVFFRCPEILICENGATNDTAVIQKGLNEYHSKRYQDAQPFAFFRTCAESISTMDISFESDRLAAVAGVAKQVSPATGSEYAAGLWVDDIFKDLIFERNTRDKGGLEKYVESLRDRHLAIGPTWSWPGHRGGVSWDSNFSSMNRETLELDGGDWEYECEYLDITTDKVGDNLFGQVTRGTLAVTTKVASLGEIAAHCEGEDDELIKNMLFTPEYSSQIACGIKWNWDVDVTDTPRHLAEKILVIAFSTCLYELRSEIENLYGLMVYPAEKEGEYYRIGSFEAQSSADDDEEKDTGYLIAQNLSRVMVHALAHWFGGDKTGGPENRNIPDQQAVGKEGALVWQKPDGKRTTDASVADLKKYLTSESYALFALMFYMDNWDWANDGKAKPFVDEMIPCERLPNSKKVRLG
ncbi:heterokaryon incompatibility protein [Fusarium tjaetaba]|uniref:Heterokaryon incompatibility protein n=1 Tax=Fusarium tjaetaba TaxID=1567544 RepID=A0A8H5VZF2_9HYPO|nr:heterokaryon incompatibility protein [Fusarium tjaetaba]KAF5640085.1 heterokaryon incompatibility protein [Fusarium tjaetaba]